MREQFNTETHARLRVLLAIGYALFIVYASLSPFVGWREQGLDFFDVLNAPLRLTYTAFDAAINVLSYLPFGLLVTLTLRKYFGVPSSLLVGCCVGMLLSLGMEYVQMYLPVRISSNTDLLSNSLGAFFGAVIALSITSWTWLFETLISWRSYVFYQGKETDFGLALLALWMFGQINPSLPMLGNVFISEMARQPFVKLPIQQFDVWQASVVILNLLMLGTLMLTLLRISSKVVSALLIVLSMVVAVKFFAAAVLLKSWAMLLWINNEALLGILFGVAAVFLMVRWPWKTIVSFGAVVSVGYFVIINVVFSGNSPESAKPVYHWHYGHLLTYNGLAQTIALVFPILLLFYFWRVRKI